MKTRIVSLVPSATETLIELGLEKNIVGVTRYCIRPREVVANIPKVGGTKNPNRARILELKPDIIVMDQDENRITDAEFFRSHGIKLFVTFCRSVQDSIQMIRDLGDTFQVTERANAMADEIGNALQSIPLSSRKSVLVLIWRRPYITINADTYVHSITEAFGFTNVFAERSERYPRLTTEEIVRANPAVVLFPDEPYPFRNKHIDEFRNLFPEIEAVRNNRLILCDGSCLTWHGYGTLKALREFPSVAPAARRPEF